MIHLARFMEFVYMEAWASWDIHLLGEYTTIAREREKQFADAVTFSNSPFSLSWRNR